MHYKTKSKFNLNILETEQLRQILSDLFNEINLDSCELFLNFIFIYFFFVASYFVGNLEILLKRD